MRVERSMNWNEWGIDWKELACGCGTVECILCVCVVVVVLVFVCLFVCLKWPQVNGRSLWMQSGCHCFPCKTMKSIFFPSNIFAICCMWQTVDHRDANHYGKNAQAFFLKSSCLSCFFQFHSTVAWNALFVCVLSCSLCVCLLSARTQLFKSHPAKQILNI